MTTWDVHHGDIFDLRADALVCSANVFLTLSGGVGGELLRRYGQAVQEPLNGHLRRLGLRHVPRGTVIAVPAGGTPYRVILHAVAVDGMYESTPAVVTATIVEAMRQAVQAGARTAVMPALATGYGRLSMGGFIQGLTRATAARVGLDRVTVALRDDQDARQLRDALTGACDS